MIYMDNNATTPCDSRVVEAMLPWFTEDFGNPSSNVHAFGRKASEAVEDARQRIAQLLGASAREIIFVGGATEANNLALLGLFADPFEGAAISQPTEHRSVLEPLRYLGERGVRVTLVPTDPTGRMDPDRLSAALPSDTRVVSIMAANNEIGTLQPLREIGAVCRANGILFHVDAAQGLGQCDLNVEQLGIDLLTLSAHKIYGPKGIGVLYRRHGSTPLAPILLGGGHEGGLRSGTLNVPGIVGLARAAELACAGQKEEVSRLTACRRRLLERLTDGLDGITLNGHPEFRLAGNLNVTVDGLDGDALLIALREVALSSGSACDSASEGPSHVLTAIGLSHARTRSTMRFGMGRFTTDDEVERVADLVIEKAVRQRKLASRLPRKSDRRPDQRL